VSSLPVLEACQCDAIEVGYREGAARRREAKLEQVHHVVGEVGRHVHVKRELMLCVKVGIGELSVHLGVCSRHGEADARQHVVGGNPVHVVLIHLCADYDAVFILVLLALPLTCSFLANVLGPARSLVVLLHLLWGHVGVY